MGGPPGLVGGVAAAVPSRWRIEVVGGVARHPEVAGEAGAELAAADYEDAPLGRAPQAREGRVPEPDLERGVAARGERRGLRCETRGQE